jgi:hypothetical protein
VCGQNLPRLAVDACRRELPLHPFNPLLEGYDEHNFTPWLRDLEGRVNRCHMRTWPERRAWLAAMMRSFLRADDHMTWDWRDPLPTVFLYAQFLRNTLIPPASTST